jgi:[2Fe-2S] binding domain
MGNRSQLSGLAAGEDLHPMQAAFIEHDGFQYGFCASGQICSAVAMLKEVRAGMRSAGRMLYSASNNRTLQKLLRSDIGTPSYTRVPGEAPGTFALEVAMDELAYMP